MKRFGMTEKKRRGDGMCKLVKITNSLGEQIEVAEIRADAM